MTSRQHSSDSDDVRRSIDVLDKVLSEFDDIEANSGDERHLGSLIETDNEDINESTQHLKTEVPPPIDRTLKPKVSPPALPKKVRKNQPHSDQPEAHEADNQETYDESQTSGTQGSKKSFSDVSSHEYQEINSDLMGPVRKGSNQRPLRDNVPIKVQRHDATHPLPSRYVRDKSPPKGDQHQIRGRGRNPDFPLCGPLRKSRSGDVSLADDVVSRNRKQGRRNGQPRRSRSTDRMLDPNRLGGKPYPIQNMNPQMDPRIINPSLIDPRFMVHPRLIDPRLMNVKHPYYDRQFIPAEHPRYQPDLPSHMDIRNPFEEGIHFPHLMNPTAGHFPSKSPHISRNTVPFDYPPSLPPYEFPFLQDPLLQDNLGGLGYQIPFDPRLEGFDPRMMASGLGFIPEFPIMEAPPHFATGFPMDIPPRERLDFEGFRADHKGWESRILDGHHVGQEWMPPTADEARRTIEHLVRSPSDNRREDGINHISGHRAAADRRISKPHHSGRLTSAGQSDSSDRSSPAEDFPRNQRRRSQPHEAGFNAGTVPGTRPGTFRVGEAVRGVSDPAMMGHGKDVMSLPHFISGGKDSGFDEGPTMDDVTSKVGQGLRNSTHAVGGGFIVSGVFNDSSKMYIPAPPSPTPDYDDEVRDTDEAESDILQGAIYTVSEQLQDIPVKKKPIKHQISNNSVESKQTTGSSNRDSLSEDSLHEGKSSFKRKSLDVMMTEFHLGLPPFNKGEGSYSDDSLEDSSVVSPSGPSTMDFSNRRPQSMESLVSIDGSTTSFDYMSAGCSKSLSPSKSRVKGRNATTENILNLNKLTNNELNKKNSIQRAERDIYNLNNAETTSTIPPPISFDINFPPLNSSKTNKKSKIMESRIYGTSRQQTGEAKIGQNPNAKFDTIRNMIKEGLIEGINDNPPDFKPPPASEKLLNSTSSEEREDSGMGSTVSTNRTDESGGSDNHSEKSVTPPSSNVPSSLPSTSIGGEMNDIKDLDNANNNSSVNKNNLENRPCSPPPPPPKRDSSMKPTSQTPQRNQSWLFKQKRQAPLPEQAVIKSSQKTVDSSNKNKEKRSHVNDNQARNVATTSSVNTQKSVESRLSTGQFSTPYSGLYDHNRRIHPNIDTHGNFVVQESSRNRPDSLHVISEDQSSVSSHGSRSGRFLSRLSDSMKSGNRGSSRSSSNRATKQSPTARVHGDIIRNPRPVISPPDLPTSIVSPSTVVPFTRDGSGRFRSIEDLAEESLSVKKKNSHSFPDGEEHSLFEQKKKKKNATLPVNLNQPLADEELKELRRATSMLYGKKSKDDGEGSKFKFNIFKGFWRRNKYSFDKA